MLTYCLRKKEVLAHALGFTDNNVDNQLISDSKHFWSISVVIFRDQLGITSNLLDEYLKLNRQQLIDFLVIVVQVIYTKNPLSIKRNGLPNEERCFGGCLSEDVGVDLPKLDDRVDHLCLIWSPLLQKTECLEVPRERWPLKELVLVHDEVCVRDRLRISMLPKHKSIVFFLNSTEQTRLICWAICHTIIWLGVKRVGVHHRRRLLLENQLKLAFIVRLLGTPFLYERADFLLHVEEQGWVNLN